MVNSVLNLFRRSALASGLVAKEDFVRAEKTLGQEAILAGEDPKDFIEHHLIRHLTEKEVISEYQATQLSKGMTNFDLGSYIITDWIGKGGMGEVFKAEHKALGRVTAVKVLPKAKSRDKDIASFEREMQTHAKLDHPNIVRVYDAGQARNLHYLATEFIPGTDLRRLVRGQGPLSMAQAASIIAQAARGLEHAHQRELIHRDVKPGNILVTPEGIAKIADLGLSGQLQPSPDDPRAGKIVGTADYLSPEQITSPDSITAVADIYSLGCTLYYAVTGKVPFPGGKTRDKANKHLKQQPLHPRKFNPELSEEFVETIADMMEKDPKDRIQTADEVASRLEPWFEALTTVPSYQMGKSPWQPSPMPLEKEPLHDTAPEGSGEWHENRYASGSESVSGTGQETARNEEGSTGPAPPLLPHTSSETKWQKLSIGALVLIITLLLGIVIGYLLA